MPADAPTTVATSGGMRPGQRSRVAFAPLVEHAVELSGTTRRPRLVHLGTASGDQRWWNAELDEAAAVAGWELRHLNLFTMPSWGHLPLAGEDAPEELLLDADVVWVGGGSVVNLLAVWRAHGLDEVFRRVWQAGVVLGGVSAGSICWHVGGTTDSFGPSLRPVTNGLALLPFGNGVHHDSEAERRPLVQRLVAEGVLPTTHCTVPRKREVPPDGVGLVYRGTDLVEAVTEVRGEGAYTVSRSADGAGGADGGAVEERLEPRVLPGAR